MFDPEYERIQVLDGYDRISQYYLQLGDYITDDDESNNDDDGENSDDDEVDQDDNDDNH